MLAAITTSMFFVYQFWRLSKNKEIPENLKPFMSHIRNIEWRKFKRRWAFKLFQISKFVKLVVSIFRIRHWSCSLKKLAIFKGDHLWLNLLENYLDYLNFVVHNRFEVRICNCPEAALHRFSYKMLIWKVLQSNFIKSHCGMGAFL